ITVIRAPGVPGEEKRADISFSELDKLPWLDHLTVVYVPPAVHSLSFTGRELKEYLDSCTFDDQVSRVGGSRYSAAPLVYIMAALRGEGGCPWDKEQTHETLKKYLVEEAYEVLEAIEQGKPHNLCEELGDLLLQIIFHCQIASETGAFDFGDVVETLTRKLIFRHPHVFGGTRVRDSEEVRANWERLKDTEKPGRFAFSGIPRSLPALVRATKIQEEASRAGFDWDSWRGAMTKVQEEAAELAAAAEASEGIAGELGDLIFAIVNVARQLGLDAEELLNKSTDKFVRRFSYIEQRAREKGVGLTDLDLTQMEIWWEEAKKQEKI
ncbi:MAG: nucleoside triphosphate pyrophosphohydrolase, partial [Firmicutes bacterium]|nr:nucleoside triphosphate pyrophosphohydrolase [Bacillota bacterium]